jgi:sec-independent protein translocase protein TatC
LEALQDFLHQIRTSRAGSLLERAEEFRQRLLRIVVVMGVFVTAAFFGAKYIFVVLKAPLLKALPDGTLHFTGPLEVFMAYMKVAFLVGVTVTAPYALHQMWRFLAPALPEGERRFVGPLLVSSILLFLGGMVFCYFLMMPMTLDFLIGMGKDVAKPVLMVDEYVSLTVFMLLGFGVVFELPLVLIVLERLGVIRVEHLTKNRAVVVVVILVVAAVITPSPDPVSQLMMATPMYVMFEAAIIVIRWLKKREAARQANLPTVTGS